MENLINKYRKIPIQAKASLFFVISSVVQKGISLICTPIFTRLLSTEQYGQYTVYQSWHTLVLLVCSLNLYAASYNNGMMKFERDSYTTAIVGLSMINTLGVAAIYVVLYLCGMNFVALPDFFLVLMFCEVLFEIPYSFWLTRQRFEYKYKNVVVVSLIVSVMSPILGLVMVSITEYKAEARVFSFAIVQIVVGIIIAICNLKKNPHVFNIEYWKYALRIGLPLIPHYSAMVVLQQADRIMISELDSVSHAAMYGVAYSLGMILTIVTTSIVHSMIPYIYQSIKDANYRGIRIYTTRVVIITSSLFFILILLAPELMKLYAAEKYYDAIFMVPPVVISVFFMFLYSIFSNVVIYFENTKSVAIISLVGAGMNIILNYYGIRLFGYMAAAYTTLICYMFFALAHFVQQYRLTRKKLHNVKLFDAGKLGSIAVVMTFLGISCIYLYQYVMIRYLLLFVIMIVLFVFRKLIIGIIRKETE